MVDLLFSEAQSAGNQSTAPKPSSQLTCCLLQSAAEQYHTWHLIEGHTAATVRASDQTLAHLVRYLASVIADTTPHCPLHIMGWMRAQQEAGNKPATLKTRFANIRAFYHWACDWDLVLETPFAKLRPPKVPRVRKRTPRAHHLHAMLDLCPSADFHGARRRAILLLFVSTGMRKKELSTLTLADLDWTAGLVRIVMGKGQKERRVPLQREAMRALLRYVQHRGGHAGALWVKKNGAAMTGWGIASQMRRLKQYAGFTNEDFDGLCHIYRRRFAEQAVQQEMGRWETTTIGGWTDPQMLDYYTRGLSEEEHAAAQFRRFEPLR